MPEQPPKESVNHPAHYGGENNPHEVIQCLQAWGLERDALLWNAVKYIARAGKKGDALEDLKKARWYLERRIQNSEARKQAASGQPLWPSDHNKNIGMGEPKGPPPGPPPVSTCEDLEREVFVANPTLTRDLKTIAKAIGMALRPGNATSEEVDSCLAGALGLLRRRFPDTRK